MHYHEGIVNCTHEDIEYISKYGVTKKNYESWKGTSLLKKLYYTSNGVVISYRYEQISSEKNIFRASVGVWQYLIDGKIPSNLPGNSDDLIKITYDNP